MDNLQAQMAKMNTSNNLGNIDFTQKPRQEALEFDVNKQQVVKKGGFERGNKPIAKPTDNQREEKRFVEAKSTATEKPTDVPKNKKKKKKDKFGKTPSLEKQMQGLASSTKNEKGEKTTQTPASVTLSPSKPNIPSLPEGKEEYNAVYFNPKLISLIREKLTEKGIETKPLKEENQLPFIFLLKNPLKSYSMAFGKPCTFLITGYYNNGRTERVALSLIDAPVVVSETKGESIELKKVFTHITEKYGGKTRNFTFSVILSADSSAEGDAEVKTVPIEEPFSIDGIFGGVYEVDGKPKIFVRNALPLTIRENYPYFKQILNREVSEEKAGSFYRQSTREMPTRERTVFQKEMNAFSNMCKNMDDVFYTGGIISLFVEG